MQSQELLDELEAAENKKYDRFMKTEPHERSELFHDDEGRRYQFWDIGMVRNAKAEDKKQLKVFLDPIPHVLLDQNVPLRGWYKSLVEATGIRNRPCYTEAVLTQPYGGTCPVRCSFCYINHGTRGYRAQGITTVDLKYPEKVAKQLKRMQTSAAGYFSSFTDPFLDLEPIYHNTQRAAEAFDREGLPVFFLTRREYPGWAYDLLKRNKYSYAQMSINTANPETWKRLSPFALRLPDMIEQVRNLRAAGIYVSIQVNPIVPGAVPNEDIVELIHTLGASGANHLIFKFVEISFPSKKALIDIIGKRHGEAAKATLADLFTCNIGGQATIDEAYRLDALDLFKRECAKAGVTMATCYEYKFERDAAGEILNKTGVSVGGEYLTADQCHGHRVPLFTRVTPDDPFTEVEECPPSGCLTCASDNSGEARCQSDLYGKATALGAADWNRPVYAGPVAPTGATVIWHKRKGLKEDES
jgi:DNA repair photolyase